jgi:Protein of unknown function (DUF4238)
MGRSVNQHWVPQFYLREFSTLETRRSKRPQVWIFSSDESDGRERLTNVRNVCASRYLYSPPDLRGGRICDIDDKLQEVESLLARIWSKVARDDVDLGSEAVRKALALFVATMHLRHPGQREIARSVHREIVEALGKLPKRPDGVPDLQSIIIEGREFTSDTSGWQSFKAWSDEEHHRFFVQMIRAEAGNIAEILLNKRWSVVFDDRERFITSDKPVAVRHPSQYVFGIGSAGTVVSFPLSPTRVLVMDDLHHEPANQYFKAKPGSSGAFNYGIWSGGSRFMITGRPVADVLSEIVEWGGN